MANIHIPGLVPTTRKDSVLLPHGTGGTQLSSQGYNQRGWYAGDAYGEEYYEYYGTGSGGTEMGRVDSRRGGTRSRSDAEYEDYDEEEAMRMIVR